jgi:hypothetical protein
MNRPLPPNIADVEQKLQPMGQPTDGIRVAAVSLGRAPIFTPRIRLSTAERISGWRIGRAASWPRKARNQAMPFASHDVVRVDPLREAGEVGHVAAHHDGGLGLVEPDESAHLGQLEEVRDDRADADDVVASGPDLVHEAVEGREVEERAGRVEIGLDEHQAPRAVEHAQGEDVLHPRDLVVVELHGIDGAAAVLVVARVGAEHAREQDLRARAQGWVVVMARR